MLLVAFLVFVLRIAQASPAVAADRAGSQQSEAGAASPASPTIPDAVTTQAQPAYAYRPYCDPHSASYTPRYCHTSCASWWCDLYWDDRP